MEFKGVAEKKEHVTSGKQTKLTPGRKVRYKKHQRRGKEGGRQALGGNDLGGGEGERAEVVSKGGMMT